MIQHDMMMWDHGMPRADGTWNPEQRPEADVNIEFQSTAKRADEAMKLAFFFRDANEKYATDYPAAVGPHMTNTDSTPFMDIVPAISLRENERGMHTGAGWNPTWHQPIDVFATFSDKDFRLGLNAAQTTLGAVAQLAGAKAEIAAGRANLTLRLSALQLARTGRGVRVAVIDSGVHAAHPHVQGVAGGIGIDASGAMHDDYVDRLGHGTAVAAVIREKAPSAEIFRGQGFRSRAQHRPATRWSRRCAGRAQTAHVLQSQPGHDEPVARSGARGAKCKPLARPGWSSLPAAPQHDARWLPGSLRRRRRRRGST